MRVSASICVLVGSLVATSATAAVMPPVPFYFDGVAGPQGSQVPQAYYDLTDYNVLPVADQVLLWGASNRVNSNYNQQFAITNSFIDAVNDPLNGWTGSSSTTFSQVSFEPNPESGSTSNRYMTMVFDQNETGGGREVNLERIRIVIDGATMWDFDAAMASMAFPTPPGVPPRVLLNDQTNCPSCNLTLTSNSGGADVVLQISQGYIYAWARSQGIVLTGASAFSFYWEDDLTPANGNAEQWTLVSATCDETQPLYFCFDPDTPIIPLPPALPLALLGPAALLAWRRFGRRAAA